MGFTILGSYPVKMREIELVAGEKVSYFIYLKLAVKCYIKQFKNNDHSCLIFSSLSLPRCYNIKYEGKEVEPSEWGSKIAHIIPGVL